MTLVVDTFTSMAEADAARTADSRFMAGGTLVMRDVNYADQQFTRVVRVAQAPRSISRESERLVIDAGVTMADIIASPDAAFLAPVARAVGGPAIRNMATVGGNLFAPYPYGDFATALLALDSEVRLVDNRTQPLDQFFASRDNSPLVTSVAVQIPRENEFRFRKMSRLKPKGISVVSVAGWLPGASSRISGARIAFGVMGPTPLRATAAESALEGIYPDEHSIKPALSSATNGLTPQDDSLASAWYRSEIAPVLLKRLLLGEEASV